MGVHEAIVVDPVAVLCLGPGREDFEELEIFIPLEDELLSQGTRENMSETAVVKDCVAGSAGHRGWFNFSYCAFLLPCYRPVPSPGDCPLFLLIFIGHQDKMPVFDRDQDREAFGGEGL